MEFTIPTNVLQAATSRAARVIPKKATVPVLACAILRVSADTLTVTAGNMEMSYAGYYPCTVAKEGTVAINAEDLNRVASVAQGESITLTLGNNLKVSVKSGKASFTLHGVDPADYPVLPAVEGASFTMAAPDLRNVLERVLPTVAQSDARFKLNGIYLETKGERLRFVGIGAGGMRMTWVESRFVGTVNIGRALLPHGAMATVMDAIKGEDGAVTSTFSASAGVMAVGSHRFTFRLMESEFPQAYESIVPATFQRVATGDVAEWADVVGAAMVVCQEAQTLRVEWTGDTAILSGSKADAADVRMEMGASLDGPAITMCVMAGHFKETLKALGGPRVTLKMGDAFTPMVFKNPDDDSVTVVMAPLRIGG